MQTPRTLLALARHFLSHPRSCPYAAWACADGWYCGGCGRSWGLDGRPEVDRGH